ncbi:hypothetical protein [Klebsiella pneumoniae ISC21]|nr:hypothetical protein [Klebsiella pneumoniae ISC21]
MALRLSAYIKWRRKRMILRTSQAGSGAAATRHHRDIKR